MGVSCRKSQDPLLIMPWHSIFEALNKQFTKGSLISRNSLRNVETHKMSQNAWRCLHQPLYHFGLLSGSSWKTRSLFPVLLMASALHQEKYLPILWSHVQLCNLLSLELSSQTSLLLYEITFLSAKACPPSLQSEVICPTSVSCSSETCILFKSSFCWQLN